LLLVSDGLLERFSFADILGSFFITAIFDVDKSEKTENFDRNLGVVQSSPILNVKPCNTSLRNANNLTLPAIIAKVEENLYSSDLPIEIGYKILKN
jgi:hypothetical protein